jgi:hypothetical protein
MPNAPNQGQFKTGAGRFGSKPSQTRGGTPSLNEPNDTGGNRANIDPASSHPESGSPVSGNKWIPSGRRGAGTETRPATTPPARGVSATPGSASPGVLGQAAREI